MGLGDLLTQGGHGESSNRLTTLKSLNEYSRLHMLGNNAREASNDTLTNFQLQIGQQGEEMVKLMEEYHTNLNPTAEEKSDGLDEQARKLFRAFLRQNFEHYLSLKVDTTQRVYN
mmetsp:Transcript_2640/g.4408  ORF Transcript_2640/g.4408 Transcript_2640/m.4408 type:complete len:115 (+) Transcript_2640:151-495(+)